MPCAAPVMIATLPANRREPPAPPEPAPPVPSLVLDICPDYSSAHDRTQGLLGEFDPDFRNEDLSKEALVRLVREFALIAQLLDRSVFAAIGLKCATAGRGACDRRVARREPDLHRADQEDH